MAAASPHRRVLLQTTLILALAFSGCLCQYNPYAHRFTTAKPLPADVVGTYILIEQTIDDRGLTILNGQTCQIDLHADGTCDVTNYPNWDGGGDYTGLITSTGRWTIETAGTVAASNSAPDRTVWGVNLGTAAPDSLTLTGRQGPPYGLIMTQGDGDAGQVLIFERKP